MLNRILNGILFCTLTVWSISGAENEPKPLVNKPAVSKDRAAKLAELKRVNEELKRLGKELEKHAPRERSADKPPELFEIWVIKGNKGKTRYLFMGQKEKSVAQLKDVFANIASIDPNLFILVKVDRTLPVKPVQTIVKELHAAKLKNLNLVWLKRADSPKQETAEMKRIKTWAKATGIPIVDPRVTEAEEEVIEEIEDVNEDDAPAKDPTKAPSTNGDRTKPVDVKNDPPTTNDAITLEEALEVVKMNTQLTYVGPLADRTPAGRKKAVGKYGGSKGGQKAVNRALKWLANVQNDNGSWGEMKKTFSPNPGHPAHTGLAMLVFLAHGETQLSKTYGKTVQKGMKWLAEYGIQEDLKTIVKKKHGAYTHGIATLALAEACAMTKIPFLRVAMENCVEVLIDGQMKNGGFAYAYSQGPRWDLSVAGWNMQALKAARVAGSTNPKLKDAIGKSIDFCKLAYGGKGGFGYASKPGNRPNMGGVGTLCMQVLGAHDDKRVQEGCTRIGDDRLNKYGEVMADPTKWNATGSKCLYGWYYDTQAMFNAMDKDKARWKKWRQAFETVLIRAQHQEGYWETVGHGTGPNTPGRVLSTCWVALQLEVYYRYVPIFDGRAMDVVDVKKKVEILIRQLGADDFKARKAASQELIAMGSSIRALLEEGLKTDDPEIKFALKKVMKALADK